MSEANPNNSTFLQILLDAQEVLITNSFGDIDDIENLNKVITLAKNTPTYAAQVDEKYNARTYGKIKKKFNRLCLLSNIAGQAIMSLNNSTLKVFVMFMLCLAQTENVEISKDRIQEITDLSSNSVKKALTILEEKGFIAKQPNSESDMWMVNPYCVVNGKIKHEDNVKLRFEELTKKSGTLSRFWDDNFPKWQIVTKSVKINNKNVSCSEIKKYTGTNVKF